MNRRQMLIVIFVTTMAITGFPTPQSQAQTPVATCQPITDVRDIESRPWTLEDSCFSIVGDVDELHVAEPGLKFDLQDNEEYFQSYFMLRARSETGDIVSIAVQVDTDLAGIYDGDEVIVQGMLVGSIKGSDMFGKDVDIPLLNAESVVLSRESATPES